MLPDWICRLLAQMKPRVPLVQRLLTIYCKIAVGAEDGLYLPRYALIAMGGKPYIWENHQVTLSHAYMTKALKRKSHKREHVGGTKHSTEETQREESLLRSVKAKLYMIALLLLLLLISLLEGWLSQKLKETLPLPIFNLKSTIQREKRPTTSEVLDGSPPSLPLQWKD
jgi:hypothetical protein